MTELLLSGGIRRLIIAQTPFGELLGRDQTQASKEGINQVLPNMIVQRGVEKCHTDDDRGYETEDAEGDEPFLAPLLVNILEHLFE